MFDCRTILRLTACLALVFSFEPVLARTPWTSSRVVGSPDPPKPYHVERVYPKLEFRNPVELMPLGDTGRMMLLELGGKLYTFNDDPNRDQADLAIDLSAQVDQFRRAFGFAVHPDFDENRQVFIVYAGDPVARPDGTRLSRFTLSSTDPPTIDPSSEEILLTWPSGGHNGCAIRFDSRGYLYFSAGDGARPFPPDEYDVSQDLSDLRSTICRIDVNRRSEDRPYAIPDDNPFVDLQGARPEIWAYGFRNPWRFTIAHGTGEAGSDELYCGDVGWELWELIYNVKRGGNYGWSIVEGPQPIRSDIEPGPTPILKPLVAYPHAVGQSVTGGHVYRGKEHPDLAGAYLYGDYVTGLLWGLRHDGDEVTWNPVLAETGLAIITFAETREGEVLIVGYDGGIYRLVKNKMSDQPSKFPRRLSETGLFASTSSMTPAAGVYSYQPIISAWQDGATSNFVVGVPGVESIRINRQQRNWQYPAGTVFAKTLSRNSRRLETQLLHFDGINWHPYSYLWNDEQTDAGLVEHAGTVLEYEASHHTEVAQDETWTVLNRSQCRACHSRQNGGAVGFTLENLAADQVDRFVEDGVLDRHAPAGWNIAKMVDPHDPQADLEARARSYLAANCAHCHRRGGGGTVPMDLAYATSPDEFRAIDVEPSQGGFGMDGARVICPGDPYRSTLFYRLATSGTGHMPKVWTRDNDVDGLLLVHDWIRSLTPDTDDSITGDSNTGQVNGTSESLRRFARLLRLDPKHPDLLQQARSAVAEGDALSAALFERFLPPGERRKRLGSQIDADSILAMQGNAERGRSRFLEAASQQCNLCHRVGGQGRSVGPDLDGIGSKRTTRELLESILDPSKVIDPKYTNHLVATDDGRVVGGLLVEDSDQWLVIRSADGKDQRISRETIESHRMQRESVMPQGLAAEMTAEELADLLAYLASLK